MTTAKAMSATAVQQHALCLLLVSNGSNRESLPIPALNPSYEVFFEIIVVATQICGMLLYSLIGAIGPRTWFTGW